jgi:hypothetical protein
MSKKIVLVGHDLVSYTGYATRARRILDDVLRERGIRPQDVEVVAPPQASSTITRLRPNIVVALGDAAARTLIPDWDSDASARTHRGYVFEGIHGVKTIVTIHPNDVSAQWVPFRVLLSYDLQRAREISHTPAIERPERNVEIVTSNRQAKTAAADLIAAPRVAFDIEIHDEQTLACCGFAASGGGAYVFPPNQIEAIRSILEAPMPKVAQNGQFDLHFLLTRCGIRTNNLLDDTLIAWHACYPELAGASEDNIGRKRAKATRKSLAFLASLYTLDAWWKDYDWTDIEEFYVLNGRDCCITFDIIAALDRELDRLDVREIYNREIALIWPVVDMQARGLAVDEKLRVERIAALEARIETDTARLSDLVLPIIDREWERVPEHARHLFETRTVCKCCRNGKGKLAECWSCAGFKKKPGKRLLEDSGKTLSTCETCGGAGEFFERSFNAISVDQKRILLYDILRLPKRYSTKKDPKTGAKKTSLSTDEDALKGLLGVIGL